VMLPMVTLGLGFSVSCCVMGPLITGLPARDESSVKVAGEPSLSSTVSVAQVSNRPVLGEFRDNWRVSWPI
jgi:hypothetical protein